MHKLLLSFALCIFASGAFAGLEYGCQVKHKLLTTNGKWQNLPDRAYVKIKEPLFSKPELQIYPYGNDRGARPDIIALENLTTDANDSGKLIGRVREFSFYKIDKGILNGYSTGTITFHQPASTVLEGPGFDLSLDCQRL